MPLIAYQSFNANSSKDHGLAATSLQRFTMETNEYVTGKGHMALVLPHNAGSLAVPIQGPANLVPIQPIQPSGAGASAKGKPGPADDRGRNRQKTEGQTVHVFGSQISLLWQNFYREFGMMPSLMVCGEFDSSHADFEGVVGTEHVTVQAVPAAKACQSFTAISQNEVAARCRGSGEGYVVYSLAGLNIAFVHVPNKIARDKAATIAFYTHIAQFVLGSGQIIHLVIGDTNQSSAHFTMQALNAAFSCDAYKNAQDGKTITKIDNYHVTERGTNSKGTELYDVAVYRSDLVSVKSVAYLSQSSSAITVTDHCGLGVVAELR